MPWFTVIASAFAARPISTTVMPVRTTFRPQKASSSTYDATSAPKPMSKPPADEMCPLASASATPPARSIAHSHRVSNTSAAYEPRVTSGTAKATMTPIQRNPVTCGERTGARRANRGIPTDLLERPDGHLQCAL